MVEVAQKKFCYSKKSINSLSYDKSKLRWAHFVLPPQKRGYKTPHHQLRLMIMMINVMIPFLLHDPACKNCSGGKKSVENAVIIIRGGKCEKNIQIGSFNLTFGWMFFTHSFDGGGGDSIHPLYICENNRKSKCFGTNLHGKIQPIFLTYWGVHGHHGKCLVLTTKDLKKKKCGQNQN